MGSPLIYCCGAGDSACQWQHLFPWFESEFGFGFGSGFHFYHFVVVVFCLCC